MKCEVKNKPNLPARSGPGVEKRRCDYAKRTQFGGRPGSHTTKCAKRSQFAARAQEWALAAGTGNLLRGPIVRNEANSRLHRVGRRPTDVVQTNPIWRDARCGLPPRACAGRLYKQTQFAPAGWAGEAVAGAYCAKQTQLPEAGHRGGVGRGGLREAHSSSIPSFPSDA